MQQSHKCQHCGDPARIINTIKKPFWPFEIERVEARCYECYQEVIKGKLPKMTDSTFRSRRGCSIKKRHRLIE